MDNTEIRDDDRDQEAREGTSKPTTGKLTVKPSIVRGFGSMVAAFESWITPRVNTAFNGSFFAKKVDSAFQDHGYPIGENSSETGNDSTITDSSQSIAYAETSSTETLRSTSTVPSSIYSGRSRSSKRPINYHQNVPNIQERDEGPSISSSRTLNETIVQSTKTFRSNPNNPQPRDIDAPPPRAYFKIGKLIEEEPTKAAQSSGDNVSNKIILENLDREAQIQRDREVADQEAAAEAQKSYEQLVQMQRDFDEEFTRLRADREMALAYARDMAVAMRVDEKLRQDEAFFVQDLEVAQQLESRFLKEDDNRKQDLEAAAKFARILEEADAVIGADAVFAARLMEEEEMALQNDRTFAERLQAEVDREEANSAELYHKNSSNGPNRTSASEPESQPLPYCQFPSLENMRDSARINEDDRLDFNNMQQPGPTTRSDRTLAQRLFAKEQMRYTEANERWKRDLQAWSEAKDTKAQAVADGYRQQEKEQGQARRMSTERPEVIAARTSVERDVADCALCMDSLPKSQLVRPCKDFYCRPCLAGKPHVQSIQRRWLTIYRLVPKSFERETQKTTPLLQSNITSQSCIS